MIQRDLPKAQIRPQETPCPANASGSALWRVPEEAGLHTRTFMQWPSNLSVYGDKSFLSVLHRAVARVANAVADFEPVVMLMHRDHVPSARRWLRGSIQIWDIPTDDLWCRDSGPLFLVDGKGGLAISHIRFNGWGGRQTHLDDGAVAARVAKHLGIPIFERSLVGEPGGVETDGEGMLIAHESCWINRNRNLEPKAVVEARLLEAYGARKVIWAPGLKGEDITDDHIDALARIVRPGVVAIQLPKRANSDPWSRSAMATYRILAEASDAAGRRLTLERLPEPARTRRCSPDFVTSYANYYVCNGAVIVPQFADERADKEAYDTFARLYPKRVVVQLKIDEIAALGGGIHCSTQQQPAV